MKNNKTCFFYVLYSDKTCVFDQSEHAYDPAYIIMTDNTLKEITQDVLVRCSVLTSDHNAKLARHFQNLVGQCLVTKCYFQHCCCCICGGKIKMNE